MTLACYSVGTLSNVGAAAKQGACESSWTVAFGSWEYRLEGWEAETARIAVADRVSGIR